MLKKVLKLNSISQSNQSSLPLFNFGFKKVINLFILNQLFIDERQRFWDTEMAD